MSHDGHGLEDFYSSATGRVTARLLRKRLRMLWPLAPGQAVLGLGYASPYLRLWLREATCCVSVVPTQLPAWRWPRNGRSSTAVAHEEALPFPDLSFDRVLLVHGLENAESARRLLREAWRVLRDDGRILVVAPNRLGLWAHRESTPFGHGHPYSPGQLEGLLRRQMFRTTRRSAALFVPPFRAKLLLRGAGTWEALGTWLYPRFAGLTLVEAEKDLLAAVPAGAVPAQRQVLVAEGV